ncbi:hypothetical protein [Corallococcus llansteffanensis]|nr:hypothetical protein [Corallococcus llansteffanensis]
MQAWTGRAPSGNEALMLALACVRLVVQLNDWGLRGLGSVS